ncbi:hypothetical protein ACDL92_08310 [Ihubacter sp. mB4P-1]|uniref:hypothetical protein n=1 Tax=Ihubacter sp. mB4P-1 TaxID=3242370 RepID=UPI003C7D0151
MKRAKMSYRTAALAVLIAVAVILSGCDILTITPGPDLEQPVLVKQLSYCEENTFCFSYIYDEWKEIKRIEFPELSGISFELEAEEDRTFEKYGVVTIRVNLSKGVKRDTVIKTANITWDDGTKSAENLGQITLLAGYQGIEAAEDMKENQYDMLEESGGWFDGDEEEWYMWSFYACQDRKLTGVQLPSEKMEALLEDIYIDDTNAEQIDTVLDYSQDETYDVMWSFSSKADRYGIIQCPACVMARDGKDECPVAFFQVSRMIESQDSLIKYLKKALDGEI